MTDLYGVLGVDRKADADTIKRMFRKLSKQRHPDVGGTIEQFRAIEEAYRVLSDPEERAFYDATGAARVKEPPKNPNTELYDMLGQMMVVVIMEMKNPAADHLIAAMQHKLQDGIRVMNKNMVEAAEGRAKIEKVIKRIRAKTPENVLAALLRTKIEGLSMQIERGKVMLETMKAGAKFLVDYDYEVTQLLMSPDLAEALRRQDSGEYDSFFTLRTPR